jgi:HAT1-interacting factor 1
MLSSIFARSPIFTFYAPAESRNPLFQLGDIPDFTTQAEEQVDDGDDDEEEEEGAEVPADDDFETAWDILDVARVIFEKSQDKDTKLKLADVHLCLGDISLETGTKKDERFKEFSTHHVDGDREIQ